LRLTHIKLAGFKTFVDPTTIPVPGQRVGVVGPNGCGKSNVIDAVRWVLGESRASALRGESMQDVIFNGAATRKPVSRASVELKFDNALGRAAGQWSQYAEISVKRVLHRNGESQYFINNLHVRRRDVTDMFLGTGLGPRAYAIIEQGMISRIIDARPEELRVFLEEAAGISKYKERRRETESRLKDTRENLERVEDIRQELDRQLLRLEAQAEVALRFHSLSESLQTTQHLLWLVKKLDAGAGREKARQVVEKTINEQEAETASLRQTENALEHARESHQEASDALHAAQGELYAANAEVARLEQQIQHHLDTRKRLESQLSAWKNQATQLQQQGEQAGGSLSHWQEELEIAELKVETSDESVEQARDDLPQCETDFNLAQKRLAEVQRELSQAEQSLQVEQTHQAHAHKTAQQIEVRTERLRQEKNALPKPDDTLLQQQREELEILDEQNETGQERLENLQSESSAREEAVRQHQHAVQTTHQQSARLEAQIHALKGLQARLEKNQQLKHWLEKHQLDSLPRLWQSLQIEAGWEAALESVLGERIKAIGLPEAFDLHVLSGDAPPAPLTLYRESNASRVSASQSHFPFLRRYVTGPESLLDEWLHGIYAIADSGEAMRASQSLQPDEVIVSGEGHLFTRASVHFHAPQSELHGVLARQREIEGLEVALNLHLAETRSSQNALNQAESAYRILQAELASARARQADVQQRRHRLQLDVERLIQQQLHQTQRHEQIMAEIDDLAEQLEIEAEQAREHEYNIEQQAEQVAEFQEHLQDARTARLALESRLNHLRQHAQSAERAAQEASFHLRHCQSKVQESKNTQESVARQLAELDLRVGELESESDSLDQQVLDQSLQDALELRLAREKGLAAMRDQLAQASLALQQLEQQRLQSEQKLHPLRDRLEQARLKEQEARLAEEQWDEQLSEAGADLAVLTPLLEKQRINGRSAAAPVPLYPNSLPECNPLPNPPPQAGEGANVNGTCSNLRDAGSLREFRVKATNLQSEIDRLGREIEALGAVNLAALEELNSSRERKQYLDAQSQDLTEAMETLEQAIRKIDRETRSRLQETFDTVNRHFGELFPSVFGGGNARLEMTGDEILDAGITLMAQPPGKRNSSIQLLSGGEKALTALALVFALFQLNPAPFCMLDEVDAPLDDSNTERFCELVKKMSVQTQFVYVSHNKITMEMAEQLVGVTMQESGVSRVVAVDLEEAVKLKDGALL
jgi:chromosome segregation protein